MSDNDERLLPIARAVAEGSSLPWKAVRQQLSPEDSAVVDALEDISRLVKARQDPLDKPAFAPSRWAHLTVLAVYQDGPEPQFIARDDVLGREVVLTLVGPLEGDLALTERLLREARRRTQLQHPNLATVFGADYAQDRVGYWVERVPGRTLAQHLEAAGRLDAGDACRLVLDLCAALGTLHRAGLPHGNVALTQAILGADGRAVLLSSSCLSVRDSGPGPLSVLRSIEGDVFNLGVTLLRLLTGADPTDYRDSDQVVARVHQSKNRVPAAIAKIIERCVSPEAERRFADAGELEVALRSAAAGPRLSLEWIVGAAVAVVVTIVVLWLSLAGQ